MLNTGPLPASRFRTVRSTMSPSSAIQRRCQAPQPNSTVTTSTLSHRLACTVRSSRRALTEDDGRTDCSYPCHGEELQHAVTQRDLLRLAGNAAVDVHRVAQ